MPYAIPPLDAQGPLIRPSCELGGSLLHYPSISMPLVYPTMDDPNGEKVPDLHQSFCSMLVRKQETLLLIPVASASHTQK